jgi:hypothetical protein
LATYLGTRIGEGETQAASRNWQRNGAPTETSALVTTAAMTALPVRAALPHWCGPCRPAGRARYGRYYLLRGSQRADKKG